MPNTKIVDKNGNLIVVYHGTKNMFWTFDHTANGGVNGTAEGFGIYTSPNTEVTKAYGDRQIAMYANIVKPAYSTKKTISQTTLSKLIKDTCVREAERLFNDDGGYSSKEEALRDTWISNYVDTYGMSIDSAYRETAESILRMNDSDMSAIQEVMAGLAIRDYADAYDFYENSLIPVSGFDGFVTQWENSSTGEKSDIVLALNSEQLKSADLVTYDDNGEIIPLSERFKSDNKPTVEKLLKLGYLAGKGGEGEDTIIDMGEDMVRTLVINDRVGLYDRKATAKVNL